MSERGREGECHNTMKSGIEKERRGWRKSCWRKLPDAQATPDRVDNSRRRRFHRLPFLFLLSNSRLQSFTWCVWSRVACISQIRSLEIYETPLVSPRDFHNDRIAFHIARNVVQWNE